MYSMVERLLMSQDRASHSPCEKALVEFLALHAGFDDRMYSYATAQAKEYRAAMKEKYRKANTEGFLQVNEPVEIIDFKIEDVCCSGFWGESFL